MLLNLVSPRALVPGESRGGHLILVGLGVFDERHQVFGELLRRGMIRVREPVLLDYTCGNGAELLTCDWHCTIEEEYTAGVRWAIRVSKTKYSLYAALVDREAHRTLDWIRYRQASGDAPITVTLAVLTLAEAEPHPLAILKHRGEQAYYILPPRPVAEAITSVSPLA